MRASARLWLAVIVVLAAAAATAPAWGAGASGCPAGYQVWSGGVHNSGGNVCVTGQAYVNGGTIGALVVVSGGNLIVGDMHTCVGAPPSEDVAVSGDVEVQTGGTLALWTSSTCLDGGPVSLTVSGTLTNAGALTSPGCEVPPGGTHGACTTASQKLTGNVINAGTLHVAVGNTLTYRGGTLDNKGPLTIASHNAAQGIPPGGTFTVPSGAGATFVNDAGGSVLFDTTQAPGFFDVGSGNTFEEGAGTVRGSVPQITSAALNTPERASRASSCTATARCRATSRPGSRCRFRARAAARAARRRSPPAAT